MKVAILTGHKFNFMAIELIKLLNGSDLELSVIVCHDWESLLKGVIAKIKNKKLLNDSKKYLAESLPGLRKKHDFSLFYSDDVNSKKTKKILRKIAPDIAIQSGVGIIKSRILDIPKIGILNAHMALLPEYRGMNVLEWSLFYGSSLGVSVHFIDSGIDTGDILLRGRIGVEKKDTIKSLRTKADALSVDLLTKAVKKISQGSFERTRQDKKAGRQYFTMHPKLKHYIEAKLEAMQ
jgi:methionyl-tRNA formyltransferase